MNSDVVSIQVQTTVDKGGDVRVVGYKEWGVTCWSLYTRNSKGIVTWVKDIKVYGGDALNNYSEAMTEAAELSMKHHAYIEQVV